MLHLDARQKITYELSARQRKKLDVSSLFDEELIKIVNKFCTI